MATEASKFKIGLFVIVGTLIAVVAFIALGATQFFTDTRTYVTYFNESVQGLEPDSQVKFRGIPIGRVHAIDIAPDGKLAEVVMKIDADVRISHDMRIKMMYAGITGMKYLEIDRKDPDEEDTFPKLDFRPPHTVIRSTPSDLKQMFSSIEKIVDNLRELDIKGISDKINGSLDSLQRLLSKDNWKPIVANVEATTTSLKNASQRVSSMLDKPGVSDALAEAAEAIHSLKEISSRLEQEVEAIDLASTVKTSTAKMDRFMEQATLTADELRFILVQQQGNIFQILDNLRMATEALNNLATSLQTNPALLFSPPPNPRH